MPGLASGRIQPGEKPYPQETLRYWYVTPFGGRSPDLSGDVVGINRSALEQNTDLIPQQDTVVIGILAQTNTRPVFFQRFFVVVGLDESTPDALSKSPNGEAVLPRDSWEFLRRPCLVEGMQATLILNGSASKLLGPDPRRGLLDAVAKVLRKQRGG